MALARALLAYPASVEGGRREYDYEEWTRDGDFQASRRDRGRARRGETLRYETTRPDGIRPRPDGGFDIVEHKHLAGQESVLFDSIQLRAQREMARVQGRGTHEIVMSSEHPPTNDEAPSVRPSAPLGRSSLILYLNIHTRTITHRWDPAVGAWVTHP